DETALTLRLREPAHRDGTEAEHVFDPAVDGLHDRLAPLEALTPCIGLQLPAHPLRAWSAALLGGRPYRFSLPERHVGVDPALLQGREVRLRFVPGVRQHRGGPPADVRLRLLLQD